MTLKVLHITSNDVKTGGAIAVTRLHEALLKTGHHSHILTFADVPVDKTISRVDRSFFWRGVDAVTRRVADLIALPYLFRFSTPAIWSAIDKIKPDIIHLHWTYSFGIPISMLPALTRRYPLVWTFHDMWAMTGGCTNSMGCERWQSGCGNCPQWNGGLDVSSMLPLRRDSTAQIWRLKRYFFKHSNFAIIAISRWMRELAESSPMFLGKSVYLIPNCLDTNFWKPLDRDICKQVLEISPDKKVLLFVGKPQGVFAYPGRRTMLLKILAELKKQSPNLASQIVLLLVGDKGDEFVPEDYSVIAVQKVSSPAMLRICYNAADLLLSPTQFDNLPCTIQEALACGSPSIASHVGGIPDLVHHLETGFLASLESPREFAEGIYRLLTDCQLWQYVSNNARKMATEQFDDILIAKKIVEYYEYEIGKHRQI